MITFNWFKFSDLSIEQLYEILKLRSDVFVVEQNCHYLDPDGKDKVALHLLGSEDNKLVAYLRVFPPTKKENYLIFGRVLTSSAVRAKGYGKKLIQELLDYCGKNFPGVPLECSAQHYLIKFYENFGFQSYGDVYDDAGVPHIMMSRKCEDK